MMLNRFISSSRGVCLLLFILIAVPLLCTDCFIAQTSAANDSLGCGLSISWPCWSFSGAIAHCSNPTSFLLSPGFYSAPTAAILLPTVAAISCLSVDGPSCSFSSGFVFIGNSTGGSLVVSDIQFSNFSTVPPLVIENYASVSVQSCVFAGAALKVTSSVVATNISVDNTLFTGSSVLAVPQVVDVSVSLRSNITISRSNFTNYQTNQGVLTIRAPLSNILLKSCQFTDNMMRPANNSVLEFGGVAVNVLASSVSIQNSVVRNNSVTISDQLVNSISGAVNVNSNLISVASTSFIRNTISCHNCMASVIGGSGVSISSSLQSLNMSACQLLDNSVSASFSSSQLNATSVGGSVMVSGPSVARVLVQDSVFSSNILSIEALSLQSFSAGGSAMSIGTEGPVQISRCNFAGNTLSAPAASASVDGVVGGGAIFLVSQTDLQFVMEYSILSNNQALLPSLSSVISNSGGGALFAFSLTGSVTAQVTHSLIMDNYLDVSYCSSSLLQANGGGAVLLSASNNASIATSDTRWLSNTVDGYDSTVASSLTNPSSSFSGGGALFLFSRNESAVLNAVNDVYSDNFINFSGARGQLNFNGGGAIGLDTAYSPVAGAVVTVSNCTFTNNAGNMDNSTAVTTGSALISLFAGSNYNGGGAIYADSYGPISASISDTLFVNNSISAVTSLGSQSTGNGGGAVYLNTASSTTLVMSSCQCLNNSVYVDGSVALNDQVGVGDVYATQGMNQNGGGALYIADGTWANVVIVNSSFIGGVVESSDSEAGVFNFNGGGAVYVLSPVTSLVHFIGCEFVNNMLSGPLQVSQSNANGGGAVFVVSGVGYSLFTSQSCRFISNSAVSVSNFGNVNNTNGGGAIIVYSLAGNVSFTSLDDQFVSNSAYCGNSTSQYNSNGGGSVLLSALQGLVSESIVGSSFVNNLVHVQANTAFTLPMGSIDYAGTNSEGGGGVFAVCASAVITLRDSIWTHNIVYAETSIANNTLALGGGGLFVSVYNNLNVSITGSRFTDHQAYLQNAQVSAQNTSSPYSGLAQNGGSAAYLSGGTYSTSFVSVVVSDCLFEGNAVNASYSTAAAANYNGGALYILCPVVGSLAVTNVTLRGNYFESTNSIAEFYNTNGGAGLLVLSLSAQLNLLTQSVIGTNNSVYATDSASTISNSVGGGCVCVVSAVGSVNYTSMYDVFSQNRAITDRSISAYNVNGGGAVLIFAWLDSVISIIGSVYDNNFVSCNEASALLSVDNINTGSNENGGGGVYVVTNANIQATVTNVTITNNVALANAATALYYNENGGSGAYFNCVGLLQFQLLASTLSNNSLTSTGCVSIESIGSNQNGGALYLASNGQISARMTALTASSNSANVSSNVGSSNSNGGGLLYVNSDTNAELSTQSCVMHNNALYASDNTASTNALGFNSNGGGALYVYANESTYSSTNDTLSHNSVNVNSNTGYANYNGGGSLYLQGANFNAQFDLFGSVITHNLVSSLYSTAVGSTNPRACFNANGGGGIYVYSNLLSINGSLTQCHFRQNSVNSSYNFGSGGSQNGGGSVYMNTNANLTVAIVETSFVQETVVTVHDRLNSTTSISTNGGASVYVNGNNYTDVRITRSNVTDCSVLASFSQNSRGSNFDGGAFYVTSGLQHTAISSQFCRYSGNSFTSNNMMSENAVVGGAGLYALLYAESEFSSYGDIAVSNSANINSMLVGEARSGGGAFSITSIAVNSNTTVRFIGTVFSNNAATTNMARSDLGLSNGGGALYVFSSVPIVMSFSNVLFTRNIFIAQHPVSLGRSMYMGGGGMYLNANYTTLDVSMSSCVFDGNSLTIVAAESHRNDAGNGGAALYMYSDYNTVNVIDSSFINSMANMPNSSATDLSVLGGAVYVFGYYQNMVSSLDCIYSSNTLLVTNSSSKLNFNGGGGLYLITSRTTYFNSTGDTFTLNTLFADATIASTNRLGGAAIYGLSTDLFSANVTSALISGNIVFSQNTVSLGNNSNGGAVIAVARTGLCLLSVTSSQFLNNSGMFPFSVQSRSNIGGGALYVNSITAIVTIQQSQFVRNSIVAAKGTSSDVSYCGGGAVYVFSTAGSSVSMIDALFASNSANIAESDHGTTPNANGGGAVYMFNINGGVQFTALRVVAELNNYQASGGSSKSDFFTGGGAFITMSLQASAAVVLEQCQFIANTANSSHVNTSSQNLYAGGGAFMVISGQQSRMNSVGTHWESNNAIGDDTSANNNAYVGGGAVMLWTLTSGSNTLIALNASSNVFLRNAAFQNRVSGRPVYIGGGAIFLYSQFVPLQLNLQGTVFTSNTVAANHWFNIRFIFSLESTCGGGAVYLSDAEPCAADQQCAVINNCAFTDNQVQFATNALSISSNVIAGGGALFTSTQSDLYLSQASFSSNTITSQTYGTGGALYISGPAQLDSVAFAVNSAGAGGAVYAAAFITAVNLTLVNNYAGRIGGGLVSMAGQSTLSSSLFFNNTAQYYGGGLYISMTSDMTVRNSTFSQNLALSGGHVAIVDQSEFTSSGNLYANTVATLSGGAFYSYLEATVLSRDDTFINASSYRGSLILAHGVCTIDINNAFIQNSSSVEYGAILYASDSAAVTIANSVIRDCSSSNGGIYAADNSMITIINSTIATSTAYSGAAIEANDQATLSLSNVLLSDNLSYDFGGAIDALSAVSLDFTNVTFLRNQQTVSGQGSGGGALWLGSSATPAFSNVLFINNSATLGGALYLQGDALYDNVLGALQQPGAMYFSGNTAYAPPDSPSNTNAPGGGGGIFFDLIYVYDYPMLDPIAYFVNNVTSAGIFDPVNVNSASYGPLFSSSFAQTACTHSSILFPGTTLSIIGYAQDLFGHTLNTLSQTSMILFIVCDSAFCQNTEISASVSLGVAEFTWQITGHSNDTVSYTATPALLTPYFLIEANTITLTSCPVGSGYENDICQPCSAGLYSLGSNLECNGCPTNGLCFGGAAIYVLDSYWPSIDVSSQTFQPVLCPFTFCTNRTLYVPPNLPGVMSALSNNSQWANAGYVLNASSLCNLNRNGSSTLCGGCVEGYITWGYQCVKCGGPGDYSSKNVFFSMAGYFILVVIQWVGAQSKGGSVGFKSLFFLYQLSQLASYPADVFPDPSTLSYYISSFTGSIPECPFYIEPQGNLVVNLLSPIVQLLLLLVMFGLHRLLLLFVQWLPIFRDSGRWKKVVFAVKWTSSSEGYVRTVSVMLVNLYIVYLKAAFDFIICEESLDVIYHYPTLSCTEYAPIINAMIAFLASLGLLPVALAVFLVYQRHTRGSLNHLEPYAPSLYVIYKDKFFYWEAVLLARRFILLLIFFVISNSASESISQAKTAVVIVLCVFLGLQYVLQPFDTKWNNVLDQVALMGLLLFFGIFSRTDVSLSEERTLGYVLFAVLCAALLIPSAANVVAKVKQLLGDISTEFGSTSAKPEDPLNVPLLSLSKDTTDNYL